MGCVGTRGGRGGGGGGLVLVLVLLEMLHPHHDRHKAPAATTTRPPVPTHEREASASPKIYRCSLHISQRRPHKLVILIYVRRPFPVRCSGFASRIHGFAPQEAHFQQKIEVTYIYITTYNVGKDVSSACFRKLLPRLPVWCVPLI